MNATPAALLEAHPTLRRLSGQVVWCLFEDAETPAAHAQAFLDRYEATKAEALPLLAAALAAPGAPGGEDAAPWVRIRVDGPGPACAACAALDGRCLRLDGPGALAFLPPFALGCPARAERLPGAPGPGAPLVDRAAPSPHGRLVCGQWIFTHPWADARP